MIVFRHIWGNLHWCLCVCVLLHIHLCEDQGSLSPFKELFKRWDLNLEIMFGWLRLLPTPRRICFTVAPVRLFVCWLVGRLVCHQDYTKNYQTDFQEGWNNYQERKHYISVVVLEEEEDPGICFSFFNIGRLGEMFTDSPRNRAMLCGLIEFKGTFMSRRRYALYWMSF